MICRQEACRDARSVRPFKTPCAFVPTTALIYLPFTLSGRTDQCILTYNPNGADARAVRPYMLVMAILMCKMVEMASCASACRDARLVRPPKMLRAFAPTTVLFACHSPCADTRINVYKLTISTERTRGLRLLEGRLQQKTRMACGKPGAL